MNADSWTSTKPTSVVTVPRQVAGDVKMVKSIRVVKTDIQFLEDLDASGSTCTTVVPARG